MSELDDLRAQLSALTNARNAIIETAKRMIVDANRDYDEEAFPLARRIRRLEPPPAPAAPPSPVARGHNKPFSLEGTEDWSHEERDHFRKLAQATRRG